MSAHTSAGEAEREGDTESEAGSSLWAVSTEPDEGLKPMSHEIMTWAEVRYLTDWATQVPPLMTFHVLLTICIPSMGKCLFINILCPFLNFLNIYLLLRKRGRQRQNMSREGAETDRNTEFKAGFRLWAISTELTQGLNSQAMRSWPELKLDA